MNKTIFLDIKDGILFCSYEVTSKQYTLTQTTSNVVGYVGGLAKDGKTPKGTRTAKQKAALKWLVGGLAEHFGASVHGHNEYSDKACPCFDVGSETWGK